MSNGPPAGSAGTVTAPSATYLRTRLLVISAAVFALDQWTKYLVQRSVGVSERIEVIAGFFNLTHVTNTGVAFGLFPTRGEGMATLVLLALGTLALSIIALYFWKTPLYEKGLLFALALILGGALGNLTDRLLLRGVTDFLDFYLGSHHFPTFNVADSAISVGIVLLAWETIRPRREATNPAVNQRSASVAGDGEVSASGS